MLRDPITGDLDVDGLIRIFTLVALVGVFASLSSMTSGDSAIDPYYVLYDLVTEYSYITIASFMLILMALWWYEQFRGGYF